MKKVRIEKIICIIVICVISSCFIQRKTNNCNSYPKNYVPIDLNDAIEYLNCHWSEKNKKEFSSLPEKESVAKLHFGIGMGIRNGWELWKGENDLVKFFNSYEVFHPDDMSSIILTSFHRKLNGKEINFEYQAQYFRDYWKSIEEFYEKETKRANEAYNKYQLDDTITIFMEMDRKEIDGVITEETIIGLGPNYQWEYNSEKDLELKGKVIQKNISQDGADVHFYIQVISMNKIGTVNTHWGNIVVGDTAKIRLRYLKYE